MGGVAWRPGSRVPCRLTRPPHSSHESCNCMPGAQAAASVVRAEERGGTGERIHGHRLERLPVRCPLRRLPGPPHALYRMRAHTLRGGRGPVHPLPRHRGHAQSSSSWPRARGQRGRTTLILWGHRNSPAGCPRGTRATITSSGSRNRARTPASGLRGGASRRPVPAATGVRRPGAATSPATRRPPLTSTGREPVWHISAHSGPAPTLRGRRCTHRPGRAARVARAVVSRRPGPAPLLLSLPGLPCEAQPVRGPAWHRPDDQTPPPYATINRCLSLLSCLSPP